MGITSWCSPSSCVVIRIWEPRWRVAVAFRHAGMLQFSTKPRQTPLAVRTKHNYKLSKSVKSLIYTWIIKEWRISLKENRRCLLVGRTFNNYIV